MATTQVLAERMDRIEGLVLEGRDKMDNFIDFEDLSEDEEKEVEGLRKEVKSGKYFSFCVVFKDKDKDKE